METSIARNTNIYIKSYALFTVFCNRVLFIESPKRNEYKTFPFLYNPLKFFVLCWTHSTNNLNNNFILKLIAKIHKNLAKLDCCFVKMAFKGKKLQSFNTNLNHRYDCIRTRTNFFFSNAIFFKKWQCFLQFMWVNTFTIVLKTQKHLIQEVKPNALANKAILVRNGIGNYKEYLNAKNTL